jgi:serine/threonine-protein kinase
MTGAPLGTRPRPRRAARGVGVGEGEMNEARDLARVCPACGRRTAALRCPTHGSVTVWRPPSLSLARPPRLTGSFLDGRYRIDEVIGRGAFGAVYAGEQLATGQRVAIKVLLAEPQGDRAVAERRFAKEAQVLAQLRHPSTVRVFDVGVTPGGAPYFAMELVDGPNLEQVFAFLASEGRVFGEPAMIDVMHQVLGSLAEAHALGLVHRDLKPANLMLTRVGDDELLVKVVDFGVVRTEGSDLTARASSLGTPRYMSPEQCRGETVDARADLYAVACIIVEAMSGEPPFNAERSLDAMLAQLAAPPPTLESRGVAASPEVEALIARALDKAPAGRFATASTMRAVLDAVRALRWPGVRPTRLGDLFAEGAMDAHVPSQQMTEAVPRIGTSGVARPRSPAAAADVTSLDSAAAAAMDLPVADGPIAPDADPTIEPGSQELVRVPSARQLAIAIAERERQLRERDARREQLTTKVELDAERQRLVQTAPPAAADPPGRGRKPLGSGTIIGAGLPKASKPRRR